MCFALSTAWNSFRYTRANELLRGIKKLGFDSLELGFSLTSRMIDDIGPCVDNNQIKVVSLHNFCPIPKGLKRQRALPDYYPMSSTDEETRRLAVKHTKITIDAAHRLNAQAVVLHCGRVDVPDRMKELANLFRRGLKNTSEYNELKDKILNERGTSHKPYLESTLRSLEELNRFAKLEGVLLGIENRYYIREIPTLEEIGVILNNFKGSNIFYWHDTGHAQVMENLGLARHKDYLERYGRNMIGVHLHDCVGIEDHCAPSQGEIDFAMLKPYIRKETLMVIEAHSPVTGSDLKKSREFLKSIFDGRS